MGFAEPAPFLSFVDAHPEIVHDLHQTGTFPSVHLQHRAPDAGEFMVTRGRIGAAAVAELDPAQQEVLLELSPLLIGRLSVFLRGAHRPARAEETLVSAHQVLLEHREVMLRGPEVVVAEHPLVGLDADSSLRRWIEKHLGDHAPVVRHRTTVADLNVLVSLAAAGVGLAVVPGRAIDPRQPVDVCELREPWARRHHLLTWTVKDHTGSTATAALAEHLRHAAGSDPSARHAPEDPVSQQPFHDG
ncbi:LysR substrate-binding domain-containing protein [Nonomuraea sp. H19]|uniref:LysR substrate-binding domain-containing protein n=1 Tax=Nonomuraea sp. H19 TaxID=3452206 RepID=UPI003F8B432B